MQLWFARDGSVPIRDQLVTQVMLAIATGELVPGGKLPSTRALARRFHLHPNTVSSAYRQLEDLGWVTSMRGSGVYVRPGDLSSQTADAALDRLALELVRSARSAGVSLARLRIQLSVICSVA